jgi:type I restriction enzyme, S subunit
MSEWDKCKLGEIAEIIDSLHQTPKYSLDGYSMVRVTDIKKGYLNLKNTFKVDETVFNLFSKNHMPRKGDILFSRVGSYGNTSIVMSDELFCLGQNTAFIVPKQNPLYLYYFLNSPLGFNEIESSVSGSTQPTISLKSIRNFDVPVPPLPEQKAIAAVLSSLDDKIDLLHRQNRTLEAMAEILFRQWFIEEADEDWEEKSLTQIAVFLNGLACQKYPVINELDKLPVLKIKELSAGITENSDWVANDIKPDYIIEAGDVIFAWSASLMVKVWNGPKCALNQHLFKVSSVEYPKWFYLHWCKYHLAEFISIASSHSTTMGHIKRADLDAAMVLVPKDNELYEMTEIIEPLFMKQIEISKQIQTLEKLRDNLLPKLMSGEVRVSYEQQDAA